MRLGRSPRRTTEPELTKRPPPITIWEMIIRHVTVAALLAVSAPALGATPQATVEKMFAEVKAAQSMVPIAEYVHWETMFASFPEAERRVAGASTPAELKAHFVRFFEDPAKRMRELMEANLRTMPADQQAMMRKQLDETMPQMDALAKQQREKMMRTKLSVKGAKIDGNKATVAVSATRDGEARTDEIRLVKIGKRWMLPNLQSLGQSSERPSFKPPR